MNWKMVGTLIVGVGLLVGCAAQTEAPAPTGAAAKPNAPAADETRKPEKDEADGTAAKKSPPPPPAPASAIMVPEKSPK
ncbi:MAG TPA: hypothetical protein PK156_13605 [Polyangium sp.]|nr:hypothetical protein [Polyangium sp.]